MQHLAAPVVRRHAATAVFYNAMEVYYRGGPWNSAGIAAREAPRPRCGAAAVILVTVLAAVVAAAVATDAQVLICPPSCLLLSSPVFTCLLLSSPLFSPVTC